MWYEACLDRISVDVARDVQEVPSERQPPQSRAIHCTGDDLFERRQGVQQIVLGGAGQHVVVLPHHAIRVNLHGMATGDLAEPRDERGGIARCGEQRRSSRTAVHHVVPPAGVHDWKRRQRPNASREEREPSAV
jgi:hypothetical protein